MGGRVWRRLAALGVLCARWGGAGGGGGFCKNRMPNLTPFAMGSADAKLPRYKRDPKERPSSDSPEVLKLWRRSLLKQPRCTVAQGPPVPETQLPAGLRSAGRAGTLSPPQP